MLNFGINKNQKRGESQVSEAKKKVDFTTGSIMPKLILFTLPIIATNVLQMLYNAADMMVVSMSNEPNAVGAVGTTSSFISLIVNIFIGFSVGSNVTIARRIGAKDADRASRATHTAVLLSIISGVICAIIGISISKPVLIAMGNTGNVLELAHRYTIFYFAGIPFISMSNFLVSIFRAKGDSKTPLIVLSLAGMSNVLFNMFFVLVLGMSVEGVAIATVIANVISTVILAVKLMRSDDYTTLKLSKLKLDRQALRDIIFIGLPSGIQGAFFSISNMIIQSSIVTLDKMMSPDPNLSPVINGCAAQVNLDNFIYMAMNAVYQTSTTFTSQNLGAGRPDRIKRGAFLNYLLVAVVGISVESVMLIFHTPLLSLYGITESVSGSAAQIAYEIARERASVVTLFYFLCGIMEVSTGIMRGLGKSIPPFIISFIGACAIRIFWVLVVFPQNMTPFNLFVSFPISWATAAVIGFIVSMCYIRSALKKHPTNVKM